jgi:hypothetical protein
VDDHVVNHVTNVMDRVTEVLRARRYTTVRCYSDRSRVINAHAHRPMQIDAELNAHVTDERYLLARVRGSSVLGFSRRVRNNLKSLSSECNWSAM